GIRRREQQQNLRLQRVCVLELIDEDPVVARLQIAPRMIVSQQVPCVDQEISEVELPGALLRSLVCFDDLPQLVTQWGSKIGIRSETKLFNGLAQPGPRGENGFASDLFPVPAVALVQKAHTMLQTEQFG